MTPATTASAQQDQKRRRHRHNLAASGDLSATPVAMLPRVATAPADLAPTTCNAAATEARAGKARTKNQRHTSPEFADTTDLDAQISTLALIRAYGYGPVPGTPLRRDNKGSGGPRCRTAVHGVRELVTARGTVGRSIAGGSDSAGAVKAGKEGQQTKMRVWSGSPKTNREPWMGPLDSGGGVIPKPLDPSSIERQELRRTKARRLAAVKGRCLLSQVTRVLHRRDLSATAQLLSSARAEFRAAGDANGASEVDEAFIKIKTDFVMEAIEVARKSRDYDCLQRLMFEALHCFAVLARHGQVNRHDTLGASERRDADKRTYERLRHPRRLCREYALVDGRKSREAAAALARKCKYAEARLRIEDALLCFNWAGDAEEELRELQNVRGEVEMRENTTCGDRLTEGVASKLQFLTPKDYSGLFSKLSRAATAYEVAEDQDGTKVVRLVTAALNSVLSAEQRWMQASDALKERRYSSVSQLLTDAKRFISDAAKGLPFVSPSLARAGKVLSPPGGVGPVDIVAELAALDGLKDHNKSVRELEQGMLDKAQQLNTSAREVFEFTARCCRTTSRCQSGSGGSGGSGGGNSSVVGSNVRPPSPAGKGDATAGAGASAAEGVSVNAARFSLSDEELDEGQALLFKIRRSTSPPTNPDDRAAKAKARTTVHPGVRHCIEDLLDDVSETEDLITRNKALERGDKLMAAFWDTVEDKAAPAAAAAAAAPAGAAVAAAAKSKRGRHNVPPTIAVATAGGVASKLAGPTSAARAGHGEEGREWCTQQVPGPGGTLSLETTSRCLQLLADAREAYDGQGFAQQADGAARLRAGLVADRCLAKAFTLSRPATDASTISFANAEAAAAASREHGEAGVPAIGADGESRLAPWPEGGGVGAGGDGGRRGDFEVARAAAREAEENYSRAGNMMGALAARRIQMSLRGDEAMVSMAPLFEKRAYDAAVGVLDQARRLYTDAGPQGLEGMSRTRDSLGLVKEAAMRDGQRLKSEAVRELRDGDIEASSKLCEQAQSCFSFVDREGLADATADVYAAIHMVTRLASGDAVVAAAEAALGDGASNKAAQLLREAKSFYHLAQLSYEDLVDQVTTLLEERPDDLEAARKAMELQDNINGIYDSRRDGQRAVKVELRLDCMAADASLENLAQVVDHEQFGDARTLLSAAALVYERSADQARLSKAGEISSLVGLVENASGALYEDRFADAEGLVAECLIIRAALAVKQPLCLRPPDCALFKGGEDGAKTAVLLRVRAAGDADRAYALELLEAGDFEAAERAASSACKRLTWWADHHESGGGSGGGGGEAEGECCLEHDGRQAVVRAAEELTTTVAAAAGKARAEGLMREGRELKIMGDFAAAVQTLRSAAELFTAAGLAHAASETRAEAARFQAEELLLTSVRLHGEGKFEAIAARLESAEALLLGATKQTAGSILFADAGSAVAVTGASQTCVVPSGLPSSSGKIGVGNAVVDPNDPSRKSGGGGTASHVLLAPEDGSSGTGTRCRILDDLINFRPRVAGDIVMRGVAPALDAREYDRGLQLMLEAEACYAAIKAGRWMTSVAATVAAASGKEHAFSSSPSSTPKELVTKRAALDGERLRAEAASAIQKEKDPVKARELLSGAEACTAWAGVDPFAAGAAAVSKDIRIFESRASGNEVCRGLIGLLRGRDFERAKNVLEEALRYYRQGDAFKQIADTRAVMFCVERESELCGGVISAVGARDPTAALKILEEARPVFQIAAELRSAVLREAVELMGVKHKHIAILSTLCRAWIQCVNGVVPVSGDENDLPDPAVVLDGAMSDVRMLATSGTSVLDIPINLLQEACGSVSAEAARTPKTPSPEVAAVGLADPETSTSESDVVALPAALGGERMGGGGDVGSDLADEGVDEASDGGAERGSSTSSSNARRVSSSRDATGVIFDGGIDGNADVAPDFGDDAIFIDDGSNDGTEHGGGSALASSRGTASRNLQQREGTDGDWSSEEANNVGDDVRVADKDSIRPTPRADTTTDSQLAAIDNVKTESVSKANDSSGSVAKHSPSLPLPAAVDPQPLRSDGVPDDLDRGDCSSSALSGLGDNDALSLSSSTSNDSNQPVSTGGKTEPHHLTSGNEVEGAGGNGSLGGVAGESATSPAGTGQAVRHWKEGSRDAMGDACLVDGSTKEIGDELVVGARSSMLISTKSWEEPASIKSTYAGAAAARSSGDNCLPHQSAPVPESGWTDCDPIDRGRPSDNPQEAALVKKANAVLDDNTLVSSLPTGAADRQGGLPAAKTVDKITSSQDRLDEAAVAAAAAAAAAAITGKVLPDEDDDGANYDLDSDFGDGSGEDDLPAVADSGGNSGAPPPTVDGVVEANTTDEGDIDDRNVAREKEDDIEFLSAGHVSSSKAVAVEREVVRAVTDDDLDYPADIDKVEESDHGSQSDSSGRSRGSSTGEDENGSHSAGSSESAGRPSSGGSSSSSSSRHFSNSDSAEGGDSAQDHSTASSPAQTEATAISPPPKRENLTGEESNQEEDDGSYGLGSSTGESAKSSQSEQLTGAANAKRVECIEKAALCTSSRVDTPLGTHDDDGDSADAVVPSPGLDASDSMGPPNGVGTEAAENENRGQALLTAIPGNVTGKAPSLGVGDGSTEKYPDYSVYERNGGGGCGDGDGEPRGLVAGGTSPSPKLGYQAELEPVEPVADKKKDAYTTNLEHIDSSVNVRDLEHRFSLMLKSSFNTPAGSSAAEEQHAAGSSCSTANPAYCDLPAVNGEEADLPDEPSSGTDGNALEEDGPEDGDDLYSSFSHNDGDVDQEMPALLLGSVDSTDHSNFHELDPAEYEAEGAGFHYTQELDQYNSESGRHYGGAPPLPASSVVADEALVDSTSDVRGQHQASPETLLASEVFAQDGSRPGQQDESPVSLKTASYYDEGDGVAQTKSNQGPSVPPALTIDHGSGVRVSGGNASDGAIESRLDGQDQKGIVAASSSATEGLVVAEEGYDELVDDGVVGEGKQQQRQEEEPDDLFDIDDHGLSSSDDD